MSDGEQSEEQAIVGVVQLALEPKPEDGEPIAAIQTQANVENALRDRFAKRPVFGVRTLRAVINIAKRHIPPNEWHDTCVELEMELGVDFFKRHANS
jgi:hypothetical protein